MESKHCISPENEVAETRDNFQSFQKQHKAAKEELQTSSQEVQSLRSELRYRRLFEAAIDGLLIIDAVTHKIVDVNPFMAALLGYPRNALVGKELFEVSFNQSRDACRNALRILDEKGSIRCEDLSLRTKAGKRRDVELVGNLYQDGNDKIIQCNIRDITERKQEALALSQARDQLADRAGQLEHLVAERTKELMSANKQLETLVYSIAHDLRAPLRAMQGFSTMLIEKTGALLNEKDENLARRISLSAQFMDSMLQALLRFCHVSQRPIELTAVDLEEVVQMEISRFEKEIQQKSARINISRPLPAVLAHKQTLRQILGKLLGNALKFSKPEALPIVQLRAEERKDFGTALVRVWVEDNGIGIMPEHQEQIFQLFSRLHGEKYSGTGLGLAIVQKGVERMGGKVGVESAAGDGSHFWFELKKA